MQFASSEDCITQLLVNDAVTYSGVQSTPTKRHCLFELHKLCFHFHVSEKSYNLNFISFNRVSRVPGNQIKRLICI